MQLLETLLLAAARSAALAILVAAAIRLLRVRRADARLTAWAAVLIASLAMPALPLLVPEVATIERPAATPTITPSPLLITVESTATPIAPARPQPTFPWTRLAPPVYLAIAAFLLLRVSIGLVRVARLLYRSTPLPELGDPRIRETRDLTVPAAAGVILLPASWRTWDPSTLDAVLAHERAHLLHRDFALQSLARLHQSIFWFSPLAWWLERQIANLAEQASDDAALHRFNDRARYAEILLDFSAARAQAAPGLVAMARWATVSARIERILDANFHPGTPMNAKRRAGLITALAASACLIAGIAVKAQQPSTPTAPKSTPAPKAQKPSPLPAIADAPANHTDDEPAPDHAFAMFLGKTTIVSGNRWDGLRAQLQRRGGSNLIWLRRGDNEYIIDDPELIAEAKALFEQGQESMKLRQAIAEQHRDLARQHRDIAASQADMHVLAPDLQAELAPARAALDKLAETKFSGKVNELDLSTLQSKLSQAQKQLEEVQSRIEALQASADSQHEQIEAKHSELEVEAAKLEEELEAKSRQEEAEAKNAERALRRLLDKAVRDGKARKAGNQ